MPKRKKSLARVVIECFQPNGLGDCSVEMSYDGDPVMCQFLLEGAQERLDAQIEQVSVGM